MRLVTGSTLFEKRNAPIEIKSGKKLWEKSFSSDSFHFALIGNEFLCSIFDDKLQIIKLQNGAIMKIVNDFYEKNKIPKGYYQQINVMGNYIIISNRQYIIVMLLSKENQKEQNYE